MVAIARYMNVTLIVPLFDNGTYWDDNRSVLSCIFNLSLLKRQITKEAIYS